jgi:uncharacterized protein
VSTDTQSTRPPAARTNISARTAARPRRQRRPLAIATALVSVALILYLGISALAANIITTPGRRLGPETPAIVQLDFRDVRFPADSGDATIAGWYLPSDGSQRALILVRGKDDSRAGWFSDGWEQFIAGLHERGFALLLIDLRGHGASSDAHYSFGLRERHDVGGAVDWLLQQGFESRRIGVYGLSLGAAAAILNAADDQDIGALVEDSCYAEIYPVIERSWREASSLPSFFLPSTLMMSRIMFGYNIPDARPVDVVARIAPRPMLIIHGAGDTQVPFGHAEQLKAANPSAEFWRVEGVDHGGAYGQNQAVYIERVATFFEQSLK